MRLGLEGYMKIVSQIVCGVHTVNKIPKLTEMNTEQNKKYEEI